MQTCRVRVSTAIRLGTHHHDVSHHAINTLCVSQQVPVQIAAIFVTWKFAVSLLAGEFDRITTPGKVEALAQLMPRTVPLVVPSCGHLSHEEAPEELLAILTAHLSGPPDDTRG